MTVEEQKFRKLVQLHRAIQRAKVNLQVCETGVGRISLQMLEDQRHTLRSTMDWTVI